MKGTSAKFWDAMEYVRGKDEPRVNNVGPVVAPQPPPPGCIAYVCDRTQPHRPILAHVAITNKPVRYRFYIDGKLMCQDRQRTRQIDKLYRFGTIVRRVPDDTDDTPLENTNGPE
jgi:hypothetical protein